MLQKEAGYRNIQEKESERNSQSPLLIMRKKYILPFLITILILILSEYFFLQEAFGRSNIAILLLTGSGIAFSIISIVSLIKKYN